MKITREFNKNEIAILKYIADGKSDSYIAAQINTSVQTVRYWVAKLLSTFDADNRTHLAAQALRNKVIK